MKSAPAKKSPVATVEEEIANLTIRQSTLDARRADAWARLEAAKSARRNALTGDPAADLTNLNRAVREAEDEVETLDGVLVDLGEQMKSAEALLDQAKENDERAAAAKTLDGISAKVEKAAADLDEAMQLVGKAYAAMIAAIPTTLEVVDLDQTVSQEPDGVYALNKWRRPARPTDLARTVLAEALARACPSAFGLTRRDLGLHLDFGRAGGLGSVRPSFDIADLDEMKTAMTAQDAAAALITDRLALRARDILGGTASASLLDRYEPAAEPAKPAFADVSIFPTAHFVFVENEEGRRKIVEARHTSAVKEPVADAAVAAGVALRMDTPEGLEARQEERVRRNHLREIGMPIAFVQTIDPAACVDLGDPCGFTSTEAPTVSAAA